jgi:hypothetical protein
MDGKQYSKPWMKKTEKNWGLKMFPKDNSTLGGSTNRNSSD